MARNYVTNVVGDPYVRIDKFTVDYQSAYNAFIQAFEAEAIPLLDGTVKQVGALGSLQIPIGPQDFSEIFERIDPTTDQPLGQQRSLMDLMIDITSFLRKRQKQRDAAEAPEVQP